MPQSSLQFGFSNKLCGTHTCRTIMLADLRAILAACPTSAGPHDYRGAIVDENVLLKATAVTRRKSYTKLRELYALDPRVLLFRALRDLWDEDAGAQPMLALLSAVARDPILRATAPAVLEMKAGESVTPVLLAAAADDGLPGRYNSTTLKSIGQHAASSWQQSGHLTGRVGKTRARAECRPASLAYSLLCGYLCGSRGEGLFSTLWTRLLDAPIQVLWDQAAAASRAGYLEYRHAGGVIDVQFLHLLRDARRTTADERD